MNEIQEKFQNLLSERKTENSSDTASTLSSSDTKAKNRILYFLSNVKYMDRGWTVMNKDESNLNSQLDYSQKNKENPNTIDLWVFF